MSSNIFIKDISNNILYDILYNFLKLHCTTENNYFIITKEIFKKYSYNDDIKLFIDNLKIFYK